MGSIPKAQVLSYKKQSHTYQNLGGGINLTRPWGINPPAPRFWAWGDQSPKALGDQSPCTQALGLGGSIPQGPGGPIPLHPGSGGWGTLIKIPGNSLKRIIIAKKQSLPPHPEPGLGGINPPGPWGIDPPKPRGIQRVNLIILASIRTQFQPTIVVHFLNCGLLK